MTGKSESILNMRISYKNRSLIYESMGIALVRENRGATGAMLGINKMWVETRSRQNVDE